MNAEPILTKVARALREAKLEAVIIGNAAAALNGAPVTTIDIDFLVRDCAKAEPKLRRVAQILEAALIKPEIAASRVHQIVNEREDIFLDFIDTPAGMGSFNSVRLRSLPLEIGGHFVHVASLADVIASKKAVGRPKDLAVMPLLEAALAAQAADTP